MKDSARDRGGIWGVYIEPPRPDAAPMGASLEMGWWRGGCVDNSEVAVDACGTAIAQANAGTRANSFVTTPVRLTKSRQFVGCALTKKDTWTMPLQGECIRHAKLTVPAWRISCPQ